MKLHVVQYQKSNMVTQASKSALLICGCPEMKSYTIELLRSIAGMVLIRCSIYKIFLYLSIKTKMRWKAIQLS